MKLKFKAIPKRNPRNPNEAPKYYASPVYNGTYSLDELSRYIADISTVSEIDVAAVLRSFQKVFPEILQKGIRIDLEGVGMFSLGIESTPSEKIEDVSSENIKRCKLKFLGEHNLRKTLDNTSVEKA